MIEIVTGIGYLVVLVVVAVLVCLCLKLFPYISAMAATGILFMLTPGLSIEFSGNLKHWYDLFGVIIFIVVTIAAILIDVSLIRERFKQISDEW